MIRSPIGGVVGYLSDRFWSSFWAVPLLAILGAVGLAVAMFRLDDTGAAKTLERWGPPFDLTAEAASSVTEQLVTVQVALLALYFSITLLVLTLAASALGVRLIERWIARADIRGTLALWLALLAYTLVANFYADPQTTGTVPRLTVLVGAVVTVLALCWLGYAFHKLARTAHVDTEIAGLGKDFAADTIGEGAVEAPDLEGGTPITIPAHETGYIAGINRNALIACARQYGVAISLHVHEGLFLLEGDPLADVHGDIDEHAVRAVRNCLRRKTAFGTYRSDGELGPFALALLVEIAGRALSPAVNDPYTALAAIDQIVRGLTRRLSEERTGPSWLTDDDGTPRLSVPGGGVLDQAEGHLALLRQFVAPYPAVSIHLVGGYARVRQRTEDAASRERLCALAAAVCDDAMAHAENGADRDALARMRAAASGKDHSQRSGAPSLEPLDPVSVVLPSSA